MPKYEANATIQIVLERLVNVQRNGMLVNYVCNKSGTIATLDVV